MDEKELDKKENSKIHQSRVFSYYMSIKKIRRRTNKIKKNCRILKKSIVS